MNRHMLCALIALALLASGCGSTPSTTALPTAPAPPAVTVATHAATAAPSPAAAATAQPTPEGAVQIPGPNGAALAGTLRGQGAVAVMLTHQLDTTQTQWEPFADDLVSTGFTVLTFTFRGYGQSQGKKDPTLLHEDVRAAADFLRAQGHTTIVCVGASMGGTACAKAAKDAGLAGLVVLSSPTSMGDPLTLAADDFAGLAIPKLFVAAQGDPYATNVQQLYDLAQEPKQLQIVDGSAHGVDLLSDPQVGTAVQDLITTFLSAIAA